MPKGSRTKIVIIKFCIQNIEQAYCVPIYIFKYNKKSLLNSNVITNYTQRIYRRGGGQHGGGEIQQF